MLKTLLLPVLLAAAVGANPVELSPSHTLRVNEEPQGYRLPTVTLPVSYRIELRTDIHLPELPEEKFKFQGTVTIQLRAIVNTRSITLHERQLTILDAKLTGEGPEISWTKDDITHDTEKEFLILTLPDGQGDLIANTAYTLVINYEGTLREDNGGFYRSYYENENGDVVFLATTQFESTNARHAFPCYDEPGIRAPMTLLIDHHKSYSAISNQPIATENVADVDRLITEFEPTPPVQTYLLAFVVSDFSYVAKEVKDLVPQKVYARPAAIENDEADYAVDAGIKILTDLEQYLETPFSLSKMDQVAIPDFAPGAMENWGLVTYKEEYLLSDKEASLVSKHKIATIIAHEYGHQFFGNHVSPEWWSFLWLNEGFATLYEYTTTSRVFPEFQSIDFMIRDSVQYSLVSDGLESTRAMTSYAESPGGISALFDDIAYEKCNYLTKIQST